MEELLEKNAEGQELIKEKYLTFIVDGQSYGLQIGHIIEIIGVQSITNVPKLPYYIKGIINLRGKIIPVMDLANRFRKESKPYNERTCIVVVEHEDLVVGLIVEQIDEVIDLALKEISLPPSSQGSGENPFISGIIRYGEKVSLLLNCKEILTR